MSSRVAKWWLAIPLLGLFAWPGCSSINPLCGSARPVPALASINPTSVTAGEAQGTFLLKVTGSNFVSSSVVVINKVQIATNVTSSSTITATVQSGDLNGAGSYGVWVNTPAGNSGDLGCSSGGSSSQATLTVE